MPRLAGFLAVTLLLGIAPAAGDDSPPARRIAERTVAATVGIRCELDRFIEHRGAGVVISPDGHILTATSVVPPGANKIRVAFPGFVVRDAAVVAVDEALAVIIIKVDASGLPYMTLSSDLPAVGSTAYTAGNVENSLLISGAASFSRGLVSGVYDVPKHPEAAYAGVAIETTAAVNAGSDGGPLVDHTGRVCGVITLGTLPLRWQGTAVPTKVLLEKFAALKSVLPPDATRPAAGVTPADDPLRAVAAKIADCLAGIEVERQFPVERLPRPSWARFKAGIKDYASLPEPEQQQAFNEYAAVARVFEVNQILRRPPGAATGLVISADGFVLTSLFNLGGDIAFVRKSTGKPPAFDAHEPIQKLLAESTDDLEQRPNAITKISVVLKNGSRHEAKFVAEHVPLGVAMLKIDSQNLAWYDVAGNAVAPQPGDAVGLVGHLPGGIPAFTLNSGIVSAPARNLGYQFQTDALLNYGNSGGPLFDCHGNFFGLAAAPLDPDTILGRLMGPQQLQAWTVAPNSGVGMAARADRIRDVLGALKSGKSFERLSGVEADRSKASDDNVAGGASRTAPATDMVKLCARVRPAFVFLAGGSGVVVRPDGLMITNEHVIAGRQSHTVRLGDGRSFRAQLLGTDPHGDLAALKLELADGQTVPFLELGDSDALAVGDETLAVGNPFGLGVLDQFPTFTAGIVSALHHTQWTYTECIVSDTEVNPGNSGGPLLDMGGRVVGINGQMTTRFGLASNTGLGFAISAKQIKLWLPRLEAAGGGEVKHGRIPGLGFAAGMVERFESVKVQDVAEGSAAAQAGFKPGDVILRLDDAPVANAVRMATILGIYPEGQDVEVTVQRGGAEVVLRTTLVAPKRCQVGMRLDRPRGDAFVPRVSEVEAGTPAATGGLRVGDEIVAVNGLPIRLRSQQEFRALERSLREQFNDGTIFTFKVRRGRGENKEPDELDVRVVGR